jgi:hypothetical protein
MTVASETGTGERKSQLQRVSPLEEMLDAAVESERPLSALARRARERAAERALEVSRLREAARPVKDGSNAAVAVRARPPAREGARAAPEALGLRAAPEASGWLQGAAVALGVVALLTAFLGPVSPSWRATTEVVMPTLPPPSVPAEPPHELSTPRVEVANSAPSRVDAELESRAAMLQPPAAPGRDAPRAALESEAPQSSAVPTPPARSGTAHAISAPAAPRAQAGAGRASAEKRADVYTVDDMFGIGGDEPLPPEALDAPASASRPPPHPAKRTHNAAVSSALFYQKLPF